MKKLFFAIICLCLMTSCANMSEKQKRTNWIVASVLVGAVIISSGNGDTIVHKNVHCQPHSNCGESGNEDD